MKKNRKKLVEDMSSEIDKAERPRVPDPFNKYDMVQVDLLAANVARGMPMKAALTAVGMTGQGWGSLQRRAEDGDEFAMQALNAVRLAKARWQSRQLGHIDEAAADGKWQAAKYLLEISDPESFAPAKESAVQVTHNHGGQVALIALPDNGRDKVPELVAEVLDSEGKS